MKIFGKEYKTVSEVSQKNRANTLYLYVENINNTIYAKFGEAFKQSIWDRYDATGYTQHEKQIKVWESSIGDKPIHKMLRSMFTWAGNKNENPLNTNEAYVIHSSDELDRLISTISDIVKSQKIGPDFFRDRCENLTYSPRSYQQNVINKAQNVLSVKDRCLVNLSTRGGKSFVSLNICKNIIGEKDTANILILTPFPAAEGSFEEVADYHKDFRGWKYVRLSAKSKANDFCDKNIIFCSYQFFNEDKAICQKLKDLFIDVIILDECHNTSDSERTKKLLKTLSYEKLLYMSGTPFNDIYSGYFTKDEVITFDFIDFIKFAKAHPNEVKLPNLHIKNVCNVKMLEDELIAMCPNVFKEADAFDFPTIFSEEQHAEAFFTWLFRPVKSNPLIVSTKRWFDLNDQKRIIAFFSTTAQVDIAKKALEKLLPNYKILSVSGEDVDFNSVDERKVNEAFEKENTIILTCGKLTTGVTLPKLDTIWYFKNTASAEQFIQILFRTMTPCDGKTDATMYCFDSEASLKVVKEYATIRLDEMSTNISKGENDTYQTVINDILSCINFTYLADNYQWQSENPDDYFEKLHKLPYAHSVVAAFQNFESFDGVSDLGTDELKEKDLTITKPQGEATKGQCDRNNNLKKLFRDSNKNNNNNDDNEEEKTSAKVVKQLLKLLLNIDKKIFVNDFVKSYKDLEKLMPEELKDYETNYKQLLEDNKARLNQMIEDIRYKESHDKIDELLHGLSFSNSTDMKTPEALLDKMFEKFSDYNGTICDPCAGVGTMLLYAVEKYGFKKENCYGMDINEDNVKICNKLGFVNIIYVKEGAQDPKSWEKFGQMTKFNKIIMNPPYDKNLHLKILREAMKHIEKEGGEVINLSPIRWLQDPLAEYKRGSDWIRFVEIRAHISSLIEIPVKEANELFGIKMNDLGIYHLTKDGGFDCKTLWAHNSILEKMLAYKDNIYDHMTKGFMPGKWHIKVAEVKGNSSGHNFEIVSRIHMKPYRTAKEYMVKKFVKADAFKNDPNNEKFVAFDTEEEGINFAEYTHTKFFLYLNSQWKQDVHVPLKFLPFMPTYTHPWTDEDLYEYFDLNEEEIKEIENTII